METLMIVWMAFFVNLSLQEIDKAQGSFIPVGCYNDKHIENARPLPDLVVNYRSHGLNWTNLYGSVIKPCAIAAMDEGYEYFGIQFYGECWSGVKGSETYKMDGISTNCWNGVGGKNALMVYKKITTETECLHYQTISDADRAITSPQGEKCDLVDLDSDQNIWYRFTGKAGTAMADQCPLKGRCGTLLTGWLKGNPPLVQDGIVKRKVCFSSRTEYNSDGCCRIEGQINVRNCGRFYVYSQLNDAVQGCDMRFCGNYGQALV